MNKTTITASQGTILVPIDFSASSRNAIDHAIDLAGKLNMRLLLLHAYHPPLSEAISDTYKLMVNEKITGMPKDVEKDLKMYEKAVEASNKKIVCDSLFTEGELTEEIQKVAADKQVSLIVMGTHQSNALKRNISGNHTSHVVNHAPCPILIIPEDYHSTDIQKILFASDYHESDMDALRFMTKLAAHYHSELAVVHVSPKPGSLVDKGLLKNFKERAKTEISYPKIKFQLIKDTEHDVHDTLDRFLIRYQPQLLVISPRSRNFIENLFDKSVSRTFIFETDIPVLFFHTSDNGNLF
jgi:nucleotide-binding universal stress UspA family protein